MLGVLLAACSSPQAATPAADPVPRQFFVAPSGSDDAGGLSAPDAFATIQYAVEQARPGDSVFVLPGVYRDTIDLSGLSGTAEHPIVIMGVNGLPVLDGEGGLETAISCHGCTHVEISCLEVRGYTTGISVSSAGDVTLRDLVVAHTGRHGVTITDSADVVVEWLDVSRTGTLDPASAGILIEDVDGGRLADNRSYDNAGPAFSVLSSDIAEEGNESF